MESEYLTKFVNSLIFFGVLFSCFYFVFDESKVVGEPLVISFVLAAVLSSFLHKKPAKHKLSIAHEKNDFRRILKVSNGLPQSVRKRLERKIESRSQVSEPAFSSSKTQSYHRVYAVIVLVVTVTAYFIYKSM